MNIENLYKQFQLGNSLFKGQYQLTNQILESANIPKEELDRIFEKEISVQLAENIIKKHKPAIKRQKTNEGEQLNVELLVLEKKQLKDIVEAAISLMPEEQIQKIRSNA
jgi:hypothetical protein